MLHTPETWTTSGRTSAPHYQGIVYRDGTGENIAVTYHDEGGRHATLIAAAPELLTTLEAIVKLMRDWDKPTHNTTAGRILTIALPAIAKAKGG